METWGSIRELWRYPVCSLSGEKIAATQLDGQGVAGDRIWVLVDAHSGAVAAPDAERRWRFVPDMLSRQGLYGLAITLDGAVWLPLPSQAADDAASRKAGFPVCFKAVAAPGSGDTHPQPRYERGHLHLLSTVSLASLADLVSPDAMVDVRRFRPNIVVDLESAGTPFPDHAIIGRTLAIGDARIEITAPCERCSFIALAQRDLPFAKDVLHAVARHGGGGFGILGQVVTPAEIRSGDEIRLLSA